MKPITYSFAAPSGSNNNIVNNGTAATTGVVPLNGNAVINGVGYCPGKNVASYPVVSSTTTQNITIKGTLFNAPQSVSVTATSTPASVSTYFSTITSVTVASGGSSGINVGLGMTNTSGWQGMTNWFMHNVYVPYSYQSVQVYTSASVTGTANLTYIGTLQDMSLIAPNLPNEAVAGFYPLSGPSPVPVYNGSNPNSVLSSLITAYYFTNPNPTLYSSMTVSGILSGFNTPITVIMCQQGTQ